VRRLPLKVKLPAPKGSLLASVSSQRREPGATVRTWIYSRSPPPLENALTVAEENLDGVHIVGKNCRANVSRRLLHGRCHACVRRANLTDLGGFGVVLSGSAVFSIPSKYGPNLDALSLNKIGKTRFAQLRRHPRIPKIRRQRQTASAQWHTHRACRGATVCSSWTAGEVS